MCIIAYKPAGQALPEETTLRACFINNPDGAGFMYPAKNGKIRVSKGFMTFEDFMKALIGAGDMTELPLVMHFRIATQGTVNAANTHPFPVSSNEQTLSARESFSDIALAHNGIIDLTTSWGVGSYVGNTYKREPQPYSDTFEFVRQYATLIADSPAYWMDKNKVELLDRLAGSKLAILGCDKHVELIGRFERNEADGCWYSNASYQPRTIAPAMALAQRQEGATLDPNTGAWVTEVDAWSEIYDNDPIYVQAQFVPDGYYIWDEYTNTLCDTSEDMYVQDKWGMMYYYDEHTNKVYAMDYEAELTDAEGNPVMLDENMLVRFTVGG